MVFTAEIIDDPTWAFSGKTATVSGGVSIQVDGVEVDKRPVSASISIYVDGWKDKGFAAFIDRAKEEYVLYKTYYNKIMADTGFSSPAEIIADLKTKTNQALMEV